MTVLINFKICDNAKECLGVENCPTGALFWDEKKETISFDESKCNNCGICEKSCEINAIHVAKNKKEYEKIKKEIDDDPRKVSDLFVDRYGAMPIHDAFQLDPKKFDLEVLDSNKLVAVEVYKEDSIECLRNSISIKELFKGADVKFRKMEVQDKDILSQYKISKLPALLFFNKGDLVGKVEGFYKSSRKEELIRKVKEVIGK